MRSLPFVYDELRLHLLLLQKMTTASLPPPRDNFVRARSERLKIIYCKRDSQIRDTRGYLESGSRLL